MGATVGDLIRLYRTLKGWGQKTLAAEARLKQPYLSKVENNKVDPRFTEVERIARCVERPIQDFATRLGKDISVVVLPDVPPPLAPPLPVRKRKGDGPDARARLSTG